MGLFARGEVGEEVREGATAGETLGVRVVVVLVQAWEGRGRGEEVGPDGEGAREVVREPEGIEILLSATRNQSQRPPHKNKSKPVEIYSPPTPSSDPTPSLALPSPHH